MNRDDWRKRGPLLWGGWMVFRLRLLTLSEYVLCLTSPPTVCMMAVFLAGNLANVHRAVGGLSTRWTLRAHCAALVAFGTAGTFVFLIPLSRGVSGPHGQIETEWLARAGAGALSGASLVFLTYGFFTVAIFRLITKNTDTLRRLRWFYSALFPLGAVLFVAAAALAGRLQGLTVSGGASLALPLATTSFLFIKTIYGANAVAGGAKHDVP